VDLAHPISAVLPSVSGVVLDVLLSDHRPLTGRMVAKFSDGRASQKAVSVALRKLAAEGLVVAEEAEHAHRYRINEEHLATPALRMLHDMRTTLVVALRELVEGWALQPEGAWVVGPLVERLGVVRSDLEVLMIPPLAAVEERGAWSRQVGALMERTHAWTGTACTVTEWTTAELNSPDRVYDGMAGLLRSGSVALVPFDWTARSRPLALQRRPGPGGGGHGLGGA